MIWCRPRTEGRDSASRGRYQRVVNHTVVLWHGRSRSRDGTAPRPAATTSPRGTGAVSADLAVRTAFLHRPPPPVNGLVRSGLLGLLDKGLEQPVQLVCAPAGFGKSAIVSQWCEQNEWPSIWISLDPAIDHPRWFLLHLVAAVRQVFPGALDQTLQMVSAEPPPPGETIVSELSNELDELEGPIVVVLDDYHRIAEPRIHSLVASLMNHPPASLHLVIISREEPQLPVGTLRAQGRLGETRMNDLAFSGDEFTDFMEREVPRPLPQPQLTALYAATEGWPAGARLAAHALRLYAGDDAVIGAGFLDQGAQEYLVGEVIEHVPAEFRRYLVVASYFHRFSAELCDAVISDSPPVGPLPKTGADFIEFIRQQNLFVVQLDQAGVWCRFHHQFARLLVGWRDRSNTGVDLSEERMRRAAAGVFSEHGLLEEAIEQLDLAGAEDELAALAADRGRQLIEDGRWVELARLVSRIPARVRDQEPELLMLRSCVIGENGSRYREMNDILDDVERLLHERTDAGPTDRWLRGEVAVLRGVYGKFLASDFEGAIADARKAQLLLQDHPGRRLILAYVLEVNALGAAGRTDEAHRVADSLVGDPRFAGSPIDPMAAARCYLGWLEGDLDSVERYATAMRSAMTDIDTLAHYFLGISAYERNQLVDAERHLAIVVDRRHATKALYAGEAGVALAFTELAMGHDRAAEATAMSVTQDLLGARSEYLKLTAEAFIAEFDLRLGRPDGGLRWARSVVAPEFGHHFFWFDPVPALVQVLLASDPDADRGRALLDVGLESAIRRHHRPLTIRLLGIQALDLAASGDEPEALRVLESAVRMGQRGGIVRQLADLGPMLAPLLHRLDVTGDVLTHVGAILSAVEALDSGRSPGDDARAMGVTPGEPALTTREADVLRLLDARYSNKEIARELIIAPATVKKHTITLYDKLNVHGRREAVAKARSLGYLND